jgi:hypothetical protein
VSNLLAQAALTAVARRPGRVPLGHWAVWERSMSRGYLGERLVRRRLRRSGWDALESPLVVAGIGLAGAMAVLGARRNGRGRSVREGALYGGRLLPLPRRCAVRAGRRAVFAVDVTTWPRCDAERSPERGSDYHPSRHSAGRPIIAGWAFRWVAQLGFGRDAWTAPVDARRLHPLEVTDQTAAAQIRALLGRLDANGRVPLFVFDGGYDSAQLTLDLAEERVAVLVRLRSDRCL